MNWGGGSTPPTPDNSNPASITTVYVVSNPLYNQQQAYIKCFETKQFHAGALVFSCSMGRGQKFEKLRHCALTYLINY